MFNHADNPFGEGKIYLDYCATTPVDPRVVDAMMPYFTKAFGNASSIHSFGRETKIPLEESRETLARAIGAETGEVCFTSGGTEADNHALIGVAFDARQKTGRDHLIISAIEHHAVLHCAYYLQQLGFHVTILPVDEFGKVNPETLRSAITPKTFLISIMHANNEIGTVQEIETLSDVAHEHGILFHSDCVQSAGKLPLNMKQLKVDLLSISAHKFYGPKGIGALFIRRGTEIGSLVHGGAQEKGRRAGTENIALAVGCAKAFRLAVEEMEIESRRLAELRSVMRGLLSERFDGILFNGHPTESLPNIVNISFDSRKKEIDGEALLMNMDLHGVAVTSGSACTSGSLEPSHVLRAIGRDEKTTKASIRFSMGK
ncbi:MAG: cysteine desulfurase [Bacteroidota bacterium]|nr:cysteine desulfurase [Bacteroidota bacterium]